MRICVQALGPDSSAALGIGLSRHDELIRRLLTDSDDLVPGMHIRNSDVPECIVWPEDLPRGYQSHSSSHCVSEPFAWKEGDLELHSPVKPAQNDPDKAFQSSAIVKSARSWTALRVT